MDALFEEGEKNEGEGSTKRRFVRVGGVARSGNSENAGGLQGGNRETIKDETKSRKKD